MNILLTVTCLITAAMIYVVAIWLLDNYLVQKDISQRNSITNSIIQDIEIFDRLLLLVEEKWDTELATNLPKIAQELQALELDTENVDTAVLEQLRDEYGLSDLHIIDKNLLVSASTFASEVGLDMSSYSESYTQNMLNVLNNKVFFTHAVSLSTVNGNLKKYAYYSLEGSDYIVNGDIDLRERLAAENNQEVASYLFGDYVDELIDKYGNIEHIDLFILSNIDQWSLFNAGQRIDESLARALFSGEYKDNADDDSVMEHVNLQSYRKAGFKAFLRIDFDTSLVEQTKTNLSIFLFAVSMIIVIIAILLLRFATQTLLIDRFSLLLNQIREKQSDSNLKIDMPGNDELSTLSYEINEMLERIKREEDMNQWLTGISQKDSLTNVANRRWFDEKFEFEWNKAKLAKEPLSLIMIDVDFFKDYNDIYGHIAGDECLQNVARCISKQLSRPNDAVARFGGEEFICLLPNTDGEGAQKIAENMRRCIEALEIKHEASAVSEFVTISLGCLTMSGSHNVPGSKLLQSVDELLYHSKDAGRNQVSAKQHV